MKQNCLILLFLISVLVIKTNAQSTSINNNVVAQAPQVASLMKFTETPVSYFNGTANVNVPLYEIHSGNLSFPITLNYNTSGIKVAEESGIVGLGWNISTNAQVVDPIGNGNNFTKPDAAPAYVTWTPSQAPLTGLTNLITAGEVFRNSQGVCTAFSAFQSQGNAANYDPDMRILNVNGVSAKFIHPNGSAANTWICIDGQNIKLIQNPGGIYQAIMPDGTRYVFNDYVQYSSLQQNQIYTSTTYLDSIISTTGKTIIFKYINPPSSLQPLIITRAQSWVRDNVAAGPGLNDVFNYSVLTEKFLSEIDFDNGKVLFNYTSRTDLASYALGSITVWRTGDAAPFKTIRFNYSYFSYPEGNYGDYTQQLQTASGLVPSLAAMLATQQYRQQRLKLLSVQVNNEPPYSFAYDNTPMPFKTSWAQDLWGYFNGNTTQSLLPSYNYLPYAGTQMPVSIITDAENGAVQFADRSAHFNFMKAGVLTSITYPTGGYTTFQYQPNTFVYNQGQNNIVDALVVANAIGNGAQVQEFDVPDLGLLDANLIDVNPAVINVSLFCGSTGGQGVCDESVVGRSGGCSGYNYSPGVLPLDAANAGGLWALIQIKDSNGNWVTPANFTTYNPVQENIFDWQNPDIATNSCTVSNFTKNLTPGHYRIIANYPNSLPNGALGGPFASIQVSYKTWSANTPNNKGPGLKISTITDYAAGGQVALKKNITYSGGQLMTRPIFYRFLSDETHSPVASPLCVQNDNLWGAIVGGCTAPGTCNCYTAALIPRSVAIVYSDPVVPYSYSANGSLFGYSTVYEQRVDGNGLDQGRTMYTFNCQPDNYQFYGWNLPGTPSIANLTNGELVEVQQQKDIAGQYQTIHTTHYDYITGSPATYWGFKNEYRPNYVNCSYASNGEPYTYLAEKYTTNSDGSTDTTLTLLPSGESPIVMSGGMGPQDNSLGTGAVLLDGNQFLHFYPIPTGHVNVLDKIEYSFDSTTPQVVTTNYTYNALNQLATTSAVESDGKTHATQTYYPADYTSAAGTDFTRQLLGLHMLDYPIENISTVNGLAVAAGYTSYLQHDNMITPSSGFALNSIAPVSITPSIPANTRDTHYEPRVNFTYDSHGNLIQQQKVNGPLYNYLWDYNNDFPTAAVINATANDFAYSSFESTLAGNWIYSGSPVLDGTTPSGKYSYNLASGAISTANLIGSKTYNLSYWTTNAVPYTISGTIGSYPVALRSLNGWTNYLHKVTGVTGVTISGTGSIDDIHIYPSDGQMSTYVYDPLVGMTAATDTKGNTVHYDYDNNERLTDIKDLDGNIVKAYAYSFAGWPGGAPIGSFTSAAASQTFNKNDCGFGYIGGPVAYSVPAGMYSSYISQADADGKAQDDIQRNGQNNANQLGGCSIAPCSPGAITASGQNLNYTITYAPSVVLSGVVLLVITNSSGSIVGETVLGTNAGTTSGTVLTHGTYNFTLQVQGEYCPTPVQSQTQTLTL